MEQVAELPESIQEIASVIGRDRALYLVGSLAPSGKRRWRRILYVPHPRNLKMSSKIVEILGYEDAARISRAFAGLILQPANGNSLSRPLRDSRICDMARSGVPTTDIAALFVLTPRRIRDILKREKAPQDV
ncbi:hypothetical protein HEQ60_02255 [Haematospirillum sp. H1815]|uniref:hypothetical protein n=1 Tax=Haematospirillum sp. H1815 TaxID=2723108 RepID=UPI00143C0976|nr:hypothetical protein [Haematospirillum sp. H1815]NKD76594.1 hypothetical protein [Haematospirillum sp. H1815]